MKEKYSLFPELPEQGEKEAVALIEKFKKKLIETAGNTISDLYCDILHYIKTDAWTNFRNELMEGFKDYNNKKIQGEYDFKTIRKEIYKQFKDEIIKDLNQDMVKELSELKKDVSDLRDRLQNRVNY